MSTSAVQYSHCVWHGLAFLLQSRSLDCWPFMQWRARSMHERGECTVETGCFVLAGFVVLWLLWGVFRWLYSPIQVWRPDVRQTRTVYKWCILREGRVDGIPLSYTATRI